MIFAIPFFVGLAALIYLALPSRRVSKKRLGIERERLNLGKSVESVLGTERQRRLARALSLADITTEPGQFVLRVLVASVLLGIVGLLINPILGLVLLVAPYFVARSIISRKGAKRQARFADQLPDILQLLITSLRSGFGLVQSLTSVVSEAEDPIRSEFERALAETRMGRDLSDALRSLAERMDCQDLEWIVTAVEINRETGGNLSEILENTTGTIRERTAIMRKAHTLTAEGRLSARILTAMPFIILVWQWRTNPNFDVLFRGAGLLASFTAVALMIIGWLWIRKIVSIKF